MLLSFPDQKVSVVLMPSNFLVLETIAAKMASGGHVHQGPATISRVKLAEGQNCKTVIKFEEKSKNAAVSREHKKHVVYLAWKVQ